jgi:basic membrane protein A
MSRAHKLLSIAAVLTAAQGVALASPAVAERPSTASVCLVADPGGFGDASFNDAALAGAQEASRKLHVDLVTAAPGTPTGIADVTDAWAASGECDLIVGVGFIAGGAMEASVAAYPDQRFAALDHVFQTPGNATSIVFQVDQPSFLAGYVAAAASATGVVGTYGGLDIPPVTDFMNGFALGVDRYNAQTGGAVEVLGWDVDTQTGLFSGVFDDPAVGFALAEDLFDQGADTVFAVAGGTSFGSYDAAVQRKLAGDEVRVILPDVNAYDVVDRDPARVLLTSVVKDVEVATYHVIESLVDGSWSAGVVVEDLASGGADLAPFHRTNNQVPGVVRPALRDLRAAIIDGTIPTLP